MSFGDSAILINISVLARRAKKEDLPWGRSVCLCTSLENYDIRLLFKHSVKPCPSQNLTRRDPQANGVRKGDRQIPVVPAPAKNGQAGIQYSRTIEKIGGCRINHLYTSSYRSCFHADSVNDTQHGFPLPMLWPGRE